MKQIGIKLSGLFLVLICIAVFLINIKTKNKTTTDDIQQTDSIKTETLEEKFESTDYDEIIDKNDEEINFENPYFYSQKECFLSADIQYAYLGIFINGELKLQWLKEYDNGNLYKLTVESDGNITDLLGEERLNFYFYVTADNIYRLWSYAVQNGEVIEFYNNDVLLMETLDTDEKLIENGEMVCCMNEKTDELEPSEVGSHVTIIQREQITYNRVDIGASGNREFYESFVWEEGKGLVEYKSGYRRESEILYIENIGTTVEEGSEISGNDVTEINESSSVSDSNFTITLGTLFKDFHYNEEEIFSESSANNLVGTVFIDGRPHDVYFHNYADISIYTTDYNPMINDMSGENIYIQSIILWTPRFCTSKGITVGATIDELKEAYGSENLELLDEDIPERIRYQYVAGSVHTDFYIEQGKVKEIWLQYLLW